MTAVCFLPCAILIPSKLQDTKNAGFWLLSCLTHYSRRKEERCELHQARLSQLEPLIITSQYQLQQPCTDAKTFRGLATLPYLI